MITVERIAKLLSTEHGEEFVAQVEQSEHAANGKRRAKAFEDLAISEREIAEKMSDLLPKIEKAEARNEKAKAEARAAANGLGTLERFRNQFNYTHGNRIQSIQRILEQTTPQEITDAISALELLKQKTLEDGIIERDEEDNSQTWPARLVSATKKRFFSNRKSIEKRLEEINGGLAALRKLIYEPCDNIPAEISKIRKTISTPVKVEEITG